MPHRRLLRVNRAPALLLWAAVVAERLGHAPETALGLAALMAGIAPPVAGGRVSAPSPLGPAARLVPQAEGPPLADRGDGTGLHPGPAEAYLRRAFGTRLGEVRATMAALAARQEPARLEALAMPLFAAFAPLPAEPPARGVLDLARIETADCRP
jgi:hypothetical protein